MKLKSKIINSKRPLLIVGGGVEISNTKKELLQFCKKTNLPVVASWAGFGSIDNKIKISLNHRRLWIKGSQYMFAKV